MDGIVLAYFGIAMVTVVVGYAIMRWIDFNFKKVEDQRQYKMVKGYIQCYNDGQKRMALTLTKELNNNLFEMCKKMGDL